MNKLSADLDEVLCRTEGLWEELRGQRIFLTGGTGFFGCWLVESFCHANRQLDLCAQMTILTRNPAGFIAKCPHLAANPAICLEQGDVRHFDFAEGEYRFMIHAATEARARQIADAPLEMLSTIVAGTERALEFAANRGVQKFLLTSSGAVYGKQPANLRHVPETYQGGPNPLNPANVYAEGKRMSELLCAVHQTTQKSNLECKIARCWAFCGPHLPLNEHFAIGNFIGDVLAGQPIRIQGDGSARRSYLYAADLTIWLWTILFRAPALTPINVGSDHDVSILELAETVAATLNPSARIEVAREADPDAPPSRYVPDVALARELLNLRENFQLKETILRTADWYRC